MRCLLVFLLPFATNLSAQSILTRDDTLRGTITPERAWWDLTYYNLSVDVDPDNKLINGSVEVTYTVLGQSARLQIDLQPPLIIHKVTQDNTALTFERRGANAYFIHLLKPQREGNSESLLIEYGGKPVEAKRPPWDGGFQWERDSNGNPFVATSCQGLGASAWWPCKDHMYDEADSMTIRVTVPDSLMDVSNGRLRSVKDQGNGTRTFEWFVSNPINNYGVNVNIGDYVHWGDTLNGEKGVLSLDYYVLRENRERAEAQFKQVKPMLRAFEYWFGPYPFYEDGYKLVEVPYLGMEHQSSITYGNGYTNGYQGTDLSGTGWGLKWDFIIIHESGHEWFANNITYKDMADMWIHESFTNYSESLFIEYYYGAEAATDYVAGTRRRIQNDRPIIGIYNVNKSGSGDMYYKGGNMLHTIRHSINDDKLFREILRGLNATYYHSTVTTREIEQFISEKSNINLSTVFNQYLRDTRVPVFEYYFRKNTLHYRWKNCVAGFNLSLALQSHTTSLRLNATDQWQSMKLSNAERLLIDPDFITRNYYVTTEQRSSGTRK